MRTENCTALQYVSFTFLVLIPLPCAQTFSSFISRTTLTNIKEALLKNELLAVVQFDN
jgi:hypothetical protein